MEGHTVDTAALAHMLRSSQEFYEDPVKQTIKASLGSNCTITVTHNGESWTGSGFHIGSGYIGTVAHVVPEEMLKEDHAIEVSFDGTTALSASVVFSDSDTDVAVIYSQHAYNMSQVVMGDSDHLEIGDIVAVIGSPEGWHDTATVGRVSNIGQSLGEQAPTPAWNDMIFIDADILQGSSGGMVIATDGKVYGIIMGVTGQHAEVGVGQNAVVPINKLKKGLNLFMDTRNARS